MNKLSKAILDYIIRYSTIRTRKVLQIKSDVQSTHSRVLAISAKEGVKKQLYTIGAKYHTMVVLIGNAMKVYNSIDAILKDTDILENNTWANGKRRRFVRYTPDNGEYTPIKDGYDLGYIKSPVLYNTRMLFHLKFQNELHVYNMPNPAAMDAFYNNNDEGTIIYKGISKKRKAKGEREPYPELIDKEISSEDIEDITKDEYETIMMYDLELTDLIVDEEGNYVVNPESDRQYEVVSFGNGEYFEDVVKQEAVIRNNRSFETLKDVILQHVGNDSCIKYYRGYIDAVSLIKSGKMPLMKDYLDSTCAKEYQRCAEELRRIFK